MSEILLTAHRQWASRPPDQRFQTFDALEKAVEARREACSTAVWSLDGTRVCAGQDGELAITGGQLYDAARFSNWSFRQLASIAKAPADFVSHLPAHLAADVLNYQLRGHGDDDGEPTRVQVLLQDRPGDLPLLRATTSERYSRAIWDLDVVRLVRRLIDGTSFRNPLAFAGGRFGGEVEPGGLFASDRDVFITVWDEAHPVEVDGEVLHRFALFWNSEVGARTFGATLGLVRTICRNLILWGARDLIDIRLRHVGAIDEKIENEIPRILEALSLTDPIREREVIRAAIRTQVASKDEEAITWLRDQGFSLRVARAAVAKAIEEEGSAGSVWQILQGLTGHARSIPYRDQRMAIEQKAGALLDLVA